MNNQDASDGKSSDREFAEPQPNGRGPMPGSFALGLELVRYRPGRFAVCFAAWGLIHLSPGFLAVVVGRVFGALAESEDPVSLWGFQSTVWVLVFVFAGLAVARNGLIFGADTFFIELWHEQVVRLQRNLLGWLLEADGSRRLESSPSEAVSTFRDDSTDLMEYLEIYIDSGGIGAYAVFSIGVMASIDPGLTAMVVAPLAIVIYLTQRLGPEIRRRRRRLRLNTEAVTGFIGEQFGAVQAVKLANAEENLMEEFRRRNEERRKAALSDTVLTELLIGLNRNMATLTVTIVLVFTSLDSFVGSALSVGELTTFLALLPRLSYYMAFVGTAMAQHRRAGVSFERMSRLSVDAPVSALLDRTRAPLTSEAGDLPPKVRSLDDRLDRLEVRNLSFTYTDDRRNVGQRSTGTLGSGAKSAGPTRAGAIRDVSFVLERGSFTVLTGPVGAGKSTILRALLGLLPLDSGQVLWNGKEIGDPASFLVPPRSAYTPQIPRLVSDTLANNIVFGPEDKDADGRESEFGGVSTQLVNAAHLAVLDQDVPRLAAGFDTMVGARGVKLSGGQIQRSAVARMLATNADLLVFDDLSSALDLHTEAELWRRLFLNRDVTCLVVSHRPAALERADQILVVEDGTIVSS